MRWVRTALRFGCPLGAASALARHSAARAEDVQILAARDAESRQRFDRLREDAAGAGALFFVAACRAGDVGALRLTAGGVTHENYADGFGLACRHGYYRARAWLLAYDSARCNLPRAIRDLCVWSGEWRPDAAEWLWSQGLGAGDLRNSKGASWFPCACARGSLGGARFVWAKDPEGAAASLSLALDLVAELGAAPGVAEWLATLGPLAGGGAPPRSQ